MAALDLAPAVTDGPGAGEGFARGGVVEGILR